MTSAELAARQVMACNVTSEPVEFMAIDHDDACQGPTCTCNGTAWFKSLRMIVGVTGDLDAEAYWLM